MVLVENRRQVPKYIVDKEWFDNLMRDVKSAMALSKFSQTAISLSVCYGSRQQLRRTCGGALFTQWKRSLATSEQPRAAVQDPFHFRCKE